MASKFVGIDLAGDSGQTGVSVIQELEGVVTYSFPSGEWRGSSGLAAMASLVLTASLTAVDQPFSYASGTFMLLADSPDASGGLNASGYSTRATDSRMRVILSSLGLSTNYVMSPNRCQNIWRALALARQCGVGRSDVCRCHSAIVETHPRVAWSILLSGEMKSSLLRLIRGYKGSDEHELEVAVRREMLERFEIATGLIPIGATEEHREQVRQTATATSDNIEALICALIAKLHAENRTLLAGFEDSDSLQLEQEGAAVIPRNAWQIDGNLRSD